MASAQLSPEDRNTAVASSRSDWAFPRSPRSIAARAIGMRARPPIQARRCRARWPSSSPARVAALFERVLIRGGSSEHEVTRRRASIAPRRVPAPRERSPAVRMPRRRHNHPGSNENSAAAIKARARSAGGASGLAASARSIHVRPSAKWFRRFQNGHTAHARGSDISCFPPVVRHHPSATRRLSCSSPTCCNQRT